jgi:hypothetical protein
MKRTFQNSLYVFAAAIAAITVGFFLHDRDSFEAIRGTWWFFGSTSASYILLALAYSFHDERQEGPNKKWILVLGVLALSLPIGAYRVVDDFPAQPLLTYLAVTVLPLAAYLVFIVPQLLNFRFRTTSHPSRIRRILLPASLLGGASLVFASLFLRTTFEGTGLSILMRKAQWVTAGTNVSVGAFGPGAPWLNVFYIYAAYPIYLFSLLASLAALAAFARSRFSLEKLQHSRILRYSASFAIFSSLWVVSDIFWGWHFGLSPLAWAAAIATALWLATPILGAALLIAFSRGREGLWPLRALILFQFPLTAFNVLMLPIYFLPSSIAELPGLGCLIVGLLLQSWAHTVLLLGSQVPAAGTKTSGVIAIAA